MNCYVEEKTWKEVMGSFDRKAIVSRLPVSGSIELTMRCNMRCRHCYISYDKDKKELSTGKVIEILNESAEAGCLWCLITGGEPLLRDDFTDIYLHAKKIGMMVTVFTNGTLLNRYLVDMFSDYPPSSIEITLYGFTKETYERVTRVPGSFERCIKGIELLREKGLRPYLKTVVTTLNRHELKEMRNYAHRLGLKFRFDAEINPRLDGNKGPCQFRLLPEEVVKLDKEDEDIVKGLKRFYDTNLEESGFESLYTCSAGKTSFHIDPYGSLSPCLMARRPFYDLKEISFREAWTNLAEDLENRKPKLDYKCGSCRLFSLCSQCPGWAEMENNDGEKPVDYLCEITHLRAGFLEAGKHALKGQGG